MFKYLKGNLKTNRILSLIAGAASGGLLIFLIMKNKYEELKSEIEAEARRFLKNTKKYIKNKDYEKAKETLEKLFEKHEDSLEAAEGKELSTEIENLIKKEQREQEELDEKWKAKEQAVRQEWIEAREAELREELERQWEQLERDMSSILNQEWERVFGSFHRLAGNLSPGTSQDKGYCQDRGGDGACRNLSGPQRHSPHIRPEC